MDGGQRTINEFIKLRTEKGWTQQDLGDRLFVSRSLISMWELGIRKPDRISVERMAELFGVKEGDIVSDTSFVYFSQKELGLIEEEIREIAESDAYDFYYDIAKDTYYCRVMTISSAEDNCRSAFFTLYPI